MLKPLFNGRSLLVVQYPDHCKIHPYQTRHVWKRLHPIHRHSQAPSQQRTHLRQKTVTLLTLLTDLSHPALKHIPQPPQSRIQKGRIPLLNTPARMPLIFQFIDQAHTLLFKRDFGTPCFTNRVHPLETMKYSHINLQAPLFVRLRCLLTWRYVFHR